MKFAFALICLFFCLPVVAQSSNGSVPACQNLGQGTLFNVQSWSGNWGRPDCRGVDEVVNSYVGRSHIIEVEWRNSSRKCVVLKGEYLWSCRISH
jgi:hypothetical protein